MIEQGTANEVIGAGLAYGADFVDLYVEKNLGQSLNFKSSQVENVQSGVDFGIGVRLIYGQSSLYAYSNSAKKEDLLHLVKTMAQGQGMKEQGKRPQLSFNQNNTLLVDAHGYETNLSELVGLANQLDQKARSDSALVKQVGVTFLSRQQEVWIYNSLGLMAHEKRPYFRAVVNVVVQDGNQMFSAGSNPGLRGGMESLKHIPLELLTLNAVREAVTMLHAEACPAGRMPVVIDNGFGGVIFHEACGHLLETTSVEKKASVFWDKKGEMIAHPDLTAIDDGTTPYGWGSLTIDDEGMPTQRTVLIQNGKLENFMADYMGHIKTGHPRTGSGRRQNYRFQPASRMRNTFIAPGKFSRDDLLHSMGDGLYAKTMGGGSVNPATGEFNFAVLEGYLVKNGKIDKPVKGATLIGTGPDIMKKISMTGSELTLAAGMCGSVSGSIPASVGQPAIKVDDILVGGRS